MIRLKLSKRLTVITLILLLFSACTSSGPKGTWEIITPEGKVNLRISDDLMELYLNDIAVDEMEITEITDTLIKTPDGDIGYSIVDGKLKIDALGQELYLTRLE